MDLLERIFMLTLGGCMGYILARIVDRLRAIEEKVEHMDEQSQPLPQRNDDGFMQIRILKDVLYLLVLVITIAGVVRAEAALNQSEENAKNDEIARCEAGTDSRNAQRDIVDAVYSLALGFAVQPEGSPPLTPEQQAELDAYVENLDAFRANTYNKIRPSELCAPYVKDDNVDPEPISFEDLAQQQKETQDE